MNVHGDSHWDPGPGPMPMDRQGEGGAGTLLQVLDEPGENWQLENTLC